MNYGNFSAPVIDFMRQLDMSGFTLGGVRIVSSVKTLFVSHCWGVAARTWEPLATYVDRLL